MLLVWLPQAVTAKRPSATATVRQAIDQVLAVLDDPKLQQPDQRAERRRQLRQVAERYFDWEEMARRSLGPAWRQATPEQGQEFVDTFKQVLSDYYLDRIAGYEGRAEVKVQAAQRRAEISEVATLIITQSRDRIPVSCFLSWHKGGWSIHDISIEGVSLVNHYRHRFRQFLINHSLDELLQRLKQHSAR